MIFLDVDPSVVRPGWIPLIITLLLAAAIVLLMISMRRQIRKISAPRLEDLERENAEQDSTADDAADQGQDVDQSGGGVPVSGSTPASRLERNHSSTPEM